MANPAETSLACTWQMGRLIRAGMEETMGQRGLALILDPQRFPHFHGGHEPEQISFTDISGVQAGLEQAYGSLSGRGLAVRIGRVAFRQSLREMGPSVGLTELRFQLLPAKTRLVRGAELLCDLMNRWGDLQVQVEVPAGGGLRWQVERCPICWGQQADSPVCHLIVGFFQEYLAWVSGGKFFHVTETQCAAVGADQCIFQVGPKALE